uniref:Uncharacterized protein n=1 Tax=Panagrolaimus sp. ES5 TaxID=591445 RepID=A0AC34GU74_9BILA
MQPTASSAAKSASSKAIPTQPDHVTKKSNKVSEIINDYERNKVINYAVEDPDVTPVPLYGSLVQSSSTTKRPSLQLDSTKIPKEFKTGSVDSTPIEPIKPLTDSSEITGILTRSKETSHEPVMIPEMKKDTTAVTHENVSNIPDNQIHISSMPKNTNIQPIPEHVEEHIIPKSETIKPRIAEVHIPSPPISGPPKIQPKIQPPRQRVRVGAICMDGWQSSSTGRGTCSHHGGVREWLYAEI